MYYICICIIHNCIPIVIYPIGVIQYIRNNTYPMTTAPIQRCADYFRYKLHDVIPSGVRRVLRTGVHSSHERGAYR